MIVEATLKAIFEMADNKPRRSKLYLSNPDPSGSSQESLSVAPRSSARRDAPSPAPLAQYASRACSTSELRGIGSPAGGQGSSSSLNLMHVSAPQSSLHSPSFPSRLKTGVMQPSSPTSNPRTPPASGMVPTAQHVKAAVQTAPHPGFQPAPMMPKSPLPRKPVAGGSTPSVPYDTKQTSHPRNFSRPLTTSGPQSSRPGPGQKPRE
ncbi:hypothetical protein BDW74DRAFT_31239 [Aspergillus multicolor]|uniref:uncharacterized protein n=1 Tax=Aspergillus multicolor TaxID=41759 RepID=UPI003CCDB891